MNQIIPFHKLQIGAVSIDRAELVTEMANHLLAGVTVGLDLSSDFDVIQYLMNAPERYRATVVTAHLDDAIAEARQAIIAAIMTRP